MNAAGRRQPIVQERILPAPPDDVFRAWSDPESMRHWMCPAPISRADVEMDFRVGGAFRIVMRGANGDFPQHGEYLAIEPPKRLVFTWNSEFVPAAERATRVEVTFEPEGDDRTRIRLVHDELPDTGTYDGHEAGWASILEKLAARLTRTEESP